MSNATAFLLFGLLAAAALFGGNLGVYCGPVLCLVAVVGIKILARFRPAFYTVFPDLEPSSHQRVLDPFSCADSLLGLLAWAAAFLIGGVAITGFAYLVAPPAAVALAVMVGLGMQMAVSGRLTLLQLALLMALNIVLSYASSALPGEVKTLWIVRLVWDPPVVVKALMGATALLAPTLLARILTARIKACYPVETPFRSTEPQSRLNSCGLAPEKATSLV